VFGTTPLPLATGGSARPLNVTMSQMVLGERGASSTAKDSAPATKHNPCRYTASMAQRVPIVGGNWKMNTDLASAVELADDIVAGCAQLVRHCDIAVFPPFPYLQAVGKTLGHSNILLGAQDVYYESNGAYTGEVSCEMLVDLNVGIVLAGHSERRHIIGEGDELINLKVRAALDAGLWVILCIGETIEQRESGQTDAININQLRAGLMDVPIEQMRQVIIAYEPVWAIGTGRNATPQDAQAAHKVIRSTLAGLYDQDIANRMRIQYGGSVNAKNAAELFSQPDIDGGLIGGASLKSDEFITITQLAVQAKSR
jgi:triosephosphate isomerase